MPKLYLTIPPFLLVDLLIPIILLVIALNIGEPDEPSSVLHKCFILYSSSFSIPFPYDILALSAPGKCNIYIGSYLYVNSEFSLNIFSSIFK